jgi:hypothetical protein
MTPTKHNDQQHELYEATPRGIELKSRIAELVPGIVDNRYCYVHNENLKGGATTELYECAVRPIQLADVLRAIEIIPRKTSLFLGVSGTFYELDKVQIKDTGVMWDKQKDLDHQSKETLDFIGGILNTK